MNSSDFKIELKNDGRFISHLKAPRFTAKFSIGNDMASHFERKSWTNYGSGDDDIHFFGFTWLDPTPTRTEMICLMEDAALEIEEHYISPGF